MLWRVNIRGRVATLSLIMMTVIISGLVTVFLLWDQPESYDMMSDDLITELLMTSDRVSKSIHRSIFLKQPANTSNLKLSIKKFNRVIHELTVVTPGYAVPDLNLLIVSIASIKTVMREILTHPSDQNELIEDMNKMNGSDLFLYINRLRHTLDAHHQAMLNKYNMESVVLFLILAGLLSLILFVIVKNDRIKTKLVNLNERLRLTRRRLDSDIHQMKISSIQFDCMSEGCIITDGEGAVITTNNASNEALRPLNRQSWHSMFPGFLCDTDDFIVRSNIHKIERGINKYGAWEGQIDTINIKGEAYSVWAKVVEITEFGVRSNMIIVYSNISQASRMKNKLYNLAHYDKVTGIPNRNMFYSILKREQDMFARNKKPFALLFIDLDKFKRVNDTHGHDVGDHVLNTTAKRMKSCIRSTDYVCRFAGDEFVVLLTSIDHSASALGISGKIIDALTKPIKINNDEATVIIGVSIGVAMYINQAEKGDDIVTRSDNAMYVAKNNGGNRSHLAGYSKH